MVLQYAVAGGILLAPFIFAGVLQGRDLNSVQTAFNWLAAVGTWLGTGLIWGVVKSGAHPYNALAGLGIWVAVVVAWYMIEKNTSSEE